MTRPSLFLLLTLTLATLIASPGSVSADPERDLSKAINQLRISLGLPPLHREPRLTRAARQTAKLIFRTRSTDLPEGHSRQALSAVEYPWMATQMLLGAGGDARELVRTWRHEPEFRDALLLPGNWELGVGWVDGNQDITGELPPNIWVVIVAQPAKQVSDGWRQNLLDEVNKFRAQHGLGKLTLNNRLNRAAQSHADDMAVRDYFAHVSPSGRHPGNRASDFGYNYRLVLENLATGHASPTQVVEGWKRSTEGHREAMIDPRVSEVGIGYRYLPNDKGKIRTHHYWAMTLARPQ